MKTLDISFSALERAEGGEGFSGKFPVTTLDISFSALERAEGGEGVSGVSFRWPTSLLSVLSNEPKGVKGGVLPGV